MADLQIEFCGIKAKNPFWLSSSPVANTAEMIARAFDVGCGGVAYKTMALEEPGDPIINVTPRLAPLDIEDKKIVGMENFELITDRPLKDNLADISFLKKNYPNHAILVSIMGIVQEYNWQEIARMVQGAGADGLELNFSCPHGGMLKKGTGAAIGQVPEIAGKITGWVKKVAKVPVIVKLTGAVTDITLMAKAVKDNGADGLCLINSYPVVIGVDLDTFVPKPSVNGFSARGGFSGPALKPIALRCIADVMQDKEINLPVSGCGGITTWQDCAEFILLGATSLQITTAVMHYGHRIFEDMVDGLSNWMDEKGFRTINDFAGKALNNLVPLEKLDKKFRVKSVINHSLCAKDDLCYIACKDGGHKAISLNTERLPVVDDEKCVGCGLCSIVCPVWDCVKMEKK